MTKLKEKILEAKGLGVKFKLVPPGEGLRCVPYDIVK